MFGFRLDTTLKSFFEKFLLSTFCIKIELYLLIKLNLFSPLKFEVSIILKFFFFLKDL